MLILLPPSEGKTAPGRGRPLDLESLAHPELTPVRRRVLDALVSASTREDAAGLLGLGPTQHDLLRRNRELATAPTARADRVYTGVLYDAMDLGSLSTPARRRAASRVAVTSALFGLVRPADRIPAYRLSGDTTLPDLGPVSAAWRDTLGQAVPAALGRGLLVDLRSGTYAGFWRPGPELEGRVVTVRVLHEADGRRTVVSHFNKATKGRLVRALLEDGRAPKDPTGFAEVLRDLGWRVEATPQQGRGTRLDVVVEQV